MSYQFASHPGMFSEFDRIAVKHKPGNKMRIAAGLIYPGNYKRLLIASVVIILLLRLFFIGSMGLMPQDAYYFFYSQHPALSYFDHPPAIAWMLRVFTTVLGENAFAIKFADSSITLLTIISFYYFSKCFLSRARVQSAVLLLFSTLMVSILSLVSTPDIPLLLFWTLSLTSLYHAVFGHKKIYWIWSGILMGLAFDSKYTAVFLPAGVMLFLLLSPGYRKLLLTKWPWLSFLLFTITISPVIIWNVQNHFASFAFQSASRVNTVESEQFSIKNFLGLIGHQSAILMPVLFFSLLYFLYKILKKYKAKFLKIPSPQLFLLCFFIPLFGSFIIISFVYWVKLNWIMPAYISGITLLSIYMREKWIRYQLAFSILVHLVLAVEVIFYPVPVKSDDTWVGWPALAKEVKTVQHLYPNSFIFSADDYKTSAELNFYLDEMVYAKNVIGENALQFDYIGTDLRKLKGRNALFVDSNPGDLANDHKKKVAPPALKNYFDSVTELSPILIKKNNRIVRKFNIYFCTNYNNRNLPADTNTVAGIGQ